MFTACTGVVTSGPVVRRLNDEGRRPELRSKTWTWWLGVIGCEFPCQRTQHVQVWEPIVSASGIKDVEILELLVPIDFVGCDQQLLLFGFKSNTVRQVITTD